MNIKMILAGAALLTLVLVYAAMHHASQSKNQNRMTSDPVAAYAASEKAAQQDLQKAKAAADQLGQIPAGQKAALDQ